MTLRKNDRHGRTKENLHSFRELFREVMIEASNGLADYLDSTHTRALCPHNDRPAAVCVWVCVTLNFTLHAAAHELRNQVALLRAPGAHVSRAIVFSYLAVQIAATLKFGALGKVTAQIVITMTSACNLRKTFAEVPADCDKTSNRWRPITRTIHTE
ncbi:unnamed protein product [Danaus chrysippus]|uniref:(African queen) hypothetical protein n=1 Tax=Danaus chrysippus TaxID=151541 RepID=A0A8J2WDK5_9NEOP|nr:unnamed protein product [Danaus chrysippus]